MAAIRREIASIEQQYQEADDQYSELSKKLRVVALERQNTEEELLAANSRLKQLLGELEVARTQAAEQAATIARALQIPPFQLVLGVDEARSVLRGEPAPLHHCLASLDLGASSELMLVTDERAALRGAKQARIFSCHFARKLPGAPKSLPADFRADNCGGVQDAIEDLNGITYRNTDTEIRSQFGVYQT